MSMGLSREDTKQALKEGMKEWLDDRYAEFGRWSLRVILVAALGALVIFILSMQGFHKIV